MTLIQGDDLLLDTQGRIAVLVDGATVTYTEVDGVTPLTLYADPDASEEITQPLTSIHGRVEPVGGGDWWHDPQVRVRHATHPDGRVLPSLRQEAYSAVDAGRLTAVETGIALNLVTDFGGERVGIGDNTAALNNALTALAVAGVRSTELQVPPGVYRIDSPIVTPASLSNVTIRAFGGDAVFDFTNIASGATAFTVAGVESATAALASNAVVRSSSVTLAGGSVAALGLAKGSLVRVGSLAFFDADSNVGQGVDQYIGEFATVKSVAGEVVTFELPLVGGAYNTADGAYLTKVTPSESVKVEGITFRGGGNGAGQNGLAFSLTKRSRVYDCAFEGLEHRIIQVNDCIGTRIHVSDLDAGAGSTDLRYGIAITYGCQDVEVMGCEIRNCWHAIIGDGPANALAPRPGIHRRIGIKDNHILYSDAMAIDSHAGGEDWTISGNEIQGCYGGVGLRCPSATVTNNTIRDSHTGPGIWCRNQTSQPTNYVITGNRVTRPATVGIQVSSDSLAPTGGSSVDGITITTNTVTAPGTVGIFLAYTEAFTPDTIVVGTNTVKGLASAQHGIYLLKVKYAAVSGNVVSGVQPTSSAHGGIRADDVTKCAITGNVLSATSVNGAGIRFSGTCSGNMIGGNTADGFTRGLYMPDATQTNNVVGPNNFQNCSNLLTIGLGAGNSCVQASLLGAAANQTLATNAAVTITALSPDTTFHTGTLTANRAVTLSATNAYPGARKRISRSGGGAFTLDIGTGPLKSLATGQWADVEVDDTGAWKLAAFGGL